MILEPLKENEIRIFVAGTSVVGAKQPFDRTDELLATLKKHNIPYVMTAGTYKGNALVQAMIVAQKDTFDFVFFNPYVFDELKQECYLLEEYKKQAVLVDKTPNRKQVGFVEIIPFDLNKINENCTMLGNKILRYNIPTPTNPHVVNGCHWQ